MSPVRALRSPELARWVAGLLTVPGAARPPPRWCRPWRWSHRTGTCGPRGAADVRGSLPPREALSQPTHHGQMLPLGCAHPCGFWQPGLQVQLVPHQHERQCLLHGLREGGKGGSRLHRAGSFQGSCCCCLWEMQTLPQALVASCPACAMPGDRVWLQTQHNHQQKGKGWGGNPTGPGAGLHLA